MKAFFLPLGLALALSACSKDDKKGSTTTGGGQGQTGCGTPLTVDHSSGGCRIRLVTPKNCEEIDLSNGKTYEFAWTTDGTNCELPYKLFVAGNPASVETNENGEVVSMTNVFEGRINRGDFISNTGGVLQVSAANIEGLGVTTDNGTYQWQIDSFHGSGPAAQFFKVKK